jgi:DNA-binding response OmpR family regulator
MIAVLLVDDESSLLEMTRIFLEQDGEIEVDCVLSGAEALQKIADRQYDVIVSDFEMSGMDGIELLKRTKACGCETPFIIFTGKGREHVVIEALNYGADFFLQKGGDPVVQFAELGNMIRKAALRKRAEDSLHESERRYRAVVEDQTEFICRFRPDGTHVFVNEAYCRYFGKTREEIIGERFRPDLPEEDRR